MKLGIDFGTTRIVVAAADRGNYPLVPFETVDATFEWFPPLVALRGAERLYGWEAWHAQDDPTWTVVRSLKRYLEDAGPETVLEAGSSTGRSAAVTLTELMSGLLTALHRQICVHFG